MMFDVVCNHFGPSDLNIWQSDGWNENDKGGIYFAAKRHGEKHDPTMVETKYVGSSGIYDLNVSDM